MLRTCGFPIDCRQLSIFQSPYNKTAFMVIL